MISWDSESHFWQDNQKKVNSGTKLVSQFVFLPISIFVLIRFNNLFHVFEIKACDSKVLHLIFRIWIYIILRFTYFFIMLKRRKSDTVKVVVEQDIAWNPPGILLKHLVALSLTFFFFPCLLLQKQSFPYCSVFYAYVCLENIFSVQKNYQHVCWVGWARAVRVLSPSYLFWL